MTMHITPCDGLLIPDPQQLGTPDYYLPPEGRDVEPSDYWTRRLRDGDVNLTPEQPASTPAD